MEENAEASFRERLMTSGESASQKGVSDDGEINSFWSRFCVTSNRKSFCHRKWWRLNVAGMNIDYLGDYSSLYGAINRLNGYDPKRIHTGFIPLYIAGVTVFKSRYNVLESTVIASLALWLLLWLHYHDVARTDGYYYNLVNGIQSQIGTFTAFVLSSYVVKLVAEWRTQRQTYATMIGQARNFASQVTASIRPAPGETEERLQAYRNARAKLGRYTKLALELSTSKGRNVINSDCVRVHCLRLGYLCEGEWERMAPTDRHTSVFTWCVEYRCQVVIRLRLKCIHLFCRMHAIVKDAEDHGLVSPNRAAVLMESVSGIRGYANDLNNYLFQVR